MCPAIPINNLYGAGSDVWNASAYAALSVASRVSSAVKAQNAIFTLTREVWKLDSILRQFLEGIYKGVANPPPPPSEPITKEQILEAAKTCQKLYQTIDQVYIRAKRTGLTNRRFVGAALNSVKVRAEEVLEIGEALELSLDPDVDVHLDHALEDLRAGKGYDLPSVLK